jgi:hypothetical protein
MRMSILLAVLALPAALAACDQGAIDDQVSSHQSAVTAAKPGPEVPVFTVSGWDPTQAPEQGKWIAATKIEGRASAAAHVARQAAYLRAVADKLPEWRAAGLSDDEIQARQGELKLAIVGE